MYFNLFPNCLIVMGARRSTICDLQMGKFDFIPNAMAEILTNFNGETVEKVKSYFNLTEHIYIDQYYDFLKINDYGYFSENLISFPALKDDFEIPSLIENAIIDFKNDTSYFNSQLIKQLDELNCIALQLRFWDNLKNKKIEDILELTQLSKLRAIEMVVRYNETITTDWLDSLVMKNPRISSVLIYDSPQNSIIENHRAFVFVTKALDSSCCGSIRPDGFVVNYSTFFESKKFNNCLNKKISIDINGEVKNCPSMLKSFGKSHDVELKDVISIDSFTESWLINKDQIEVCKNCEFRYVCIDCRAFIVDKNNIKSKPLKCSYDPNTMKWNEIVK